MHGKSRNLLLIAATAMCLAVASHSVRAHHSFAAEFDVKKPVEIRGKVTRVELINPHSWIHVEVTRTDGAKEEWMVEGGSPNMLFRRGITKASIPIGSELVVSGFQARDGGNRCVGRTVRFADGRSLFLDATPVPESAGQ